MNRLSKETSPYLLQHAHNPVDWHPWSPEAFERAWAEQKPVIVSIGYSTCHWCHVMERESFEDPAVAAVMNRYFISIKVDREERPDVDAIYMEACQLLTGGGGWPLNCFLTPDGKPFYAGTYFPPQPAYNRPSWLDVLKYMADVWETRRETVLEQAERLAGHISKDTPPVISPSAPDNSGDQLNHIYERLRTQFDYAQGGFGGAPKFPSTMAIQLLMEYSWYYRQPEALQHAFFSLEKMISGGIYDQIGGGFSRYATDREWNIPHFEKMLYDNALLTGVLADACKIAVTQDPAGRFSVLFGDTIRETLEWVRREMTSPEGAFYTAQDADSEGVEGKFYVWNKDEMLKLLGADAEEFCHFYNVTEEGNWEHTNILYRSTGSADLEDSPHTHRKFSDQRVLLRSERSKRVPPLLDTKVLLDWNALMCSAHARAYMALGDENYRDIAVRNMDFLLDHMREDGQLVHVRTGGGPVPAFLDDYAFFIAALLDLLVITSGARYLQLAEHYTAYVLEAFYDPDQHNMYSTRLEQTDIIVRKKDFYDNATPSGNSVMVHNLQRLNLIVDRPEWRDIPGKMLDAMKSSVAQFPLSFSEWARAVLHQTQPPVQIAVIGADAVDKAANIRKRFIPNSIVMATERDENNISLFAGKQGEKESLIYLCENFVCRKPVVSLNELWEMI